MSRYGLSRPPDADPLGPLPYFYRSALDWEYEVGDRVAVHLSEQDPWYVELHDLRKRELSERNSAPTTCSGPPPRGSVSLAYNPQAQQGQEGHIMSDTTLADEAPAITQDIGSPEGVGPAAGSPEGAELPVVEDPQPESTAARVAAEEEAAADAEPPAKKDRRPRGWLEQDVKQITDKFITGEVKLEEGQYLTPHRVARMVKELDGLDEAPSSGACAAVFHRWVDLGFAVMNDKPFSFKDYTQEGRDQGLTALKEQRSSRIKAERKAEKEAAKPASEAPAPVADAAPADTAQG